MNQERELERHNRVIKQIEEASKLEELPSVTSSILSKFFADNLYFNDKKISSTAFKEITEEIVKEGYLNKELLKARLLDVVSNNYDNVSEEEVYSKINYIINSDRIPYLLEEIDKRKERIRDFERLENEQLHIKTMKEINYAFEINDLPKVGVGNLNQKIVRAVNLNSFGVNVKTDDIRGLTAAYLRKESEEQKDEIIKKICNAQYLTVEDKQRMFQEVKNNLADDEVIGYIVRELLAKEERKDFIYKNDHEFTMEAIKNANRISQLPPNLTFSSLTSYLSGNTTIYSKDDRIKNDDLKELTQLLLEGKNWENEDVLNELKRITGELYPDKNDAYELLLKKFKALPKTFYLTEEINYTLERQKEFIGRNCSNVNVYFIPNDKSPMDGGRFYNCYINRIDNLDLSQILSLNLDEIVPPSMDIDSVEWYVKENYDDTFKTAGGIILNKDETIGNVNVFQPSEGKVGVSIEEKEKLDKIADLDKQIEEKENKLSSLDSELREKEERSIDVDNKMKSLVKSYEKKALLLQKELLNGIEKIKEDMNFEDDVYQDESERGAR